MFRKRQQGPSDPWLIEAIARISVASQREDFDSFEQRGEALQAATEIDRMVRAGVAPPPLVALYEVAQGITEAARQLAAMTGSEEAGYKNLAKSALTAGDWASDHA